LAIDPILIAIQGRRDQDESSIITDLGLGACAFKPEEVKALFSALHTINEGDLRKRFDIKEIVALGLPGDGENSELDEFYLPQLNRIRTLYERAADAGQYVVVAMS